MNQLYLVDGVQVLETYLSIVLISNCLCFYSEQVKAAEDLEVIETCYVCEWLLVERGRKPGISYCLLHTDECKVKLPILIERPE